MDNGMQEDVFEQRSSLEELSRSAEQLRLEMSKVIVGQEDMMELLLAAMLSGGHVLLEGVPGVAKTLTAKMLSRAIQAPFSRIQFTPDLMPSDVIGTSVFHPGQAIFQFRKGPIFTSILLIDEINRAPAKTQSALFEVMEERQVTADGQTYHLDEPFMVVATQNPIEQEGTYRLPEAQLDRFLFKILVPLPAPDEEKEILMRHHRMLGKLEPELVSQLNGALLQQLREQVKQLHMEEKLFDFITALVTATRNHNGIYLGASPRASIGIMNASKAIAALNGRDFVTPDDILRVAAPVLRHRIALTPEKEMEGVTPDDMITTILSSIEIPR